MPVLNVICPICTETFQNSDDIYSTSCGHIFHYTCMNDWKRRGTSCPQCRSYNPTTHKLYLSFDEFEDRSAELADMEVKLKSSEDKVNELLIQMQETENNFMRLQQQYTAAEVTKKEVEQKIEQIKDYEDDFFRLQAQYTESSELIKELEDHINQLLIENECKKQELRAKVLEIESLKVNLEEGQQSFLPDSILAEKVKILEQKLKHISEEFQKEIHTSTQLSIEKMKLESYIKHIDTNQKTEETAQKCNNELYPIQNREQKKIANFNNASNRRNEQQSQHHKTVANSDCVFINELPLEQLTLPLENVIVNLASKMNLSISSNDIIKANLVNDEENVLKATLFAQFKSSHMKNNFVAKCAVLKNDPMTKFIFIGDCNNEEINKLFMYTNNQLRNKGFNCVYSKDNKIFVKRNRNQRQAIRILSKCQVDKLQTANKPSEKPTGALDEVDKLQATNKPSEKPTKTLEKQNNNIDEYFYQL